jgi:hypothetical protein
MPAVLYKICCISVEAAYSAGGVDIAGVVDLGASDDFSVMMAGPSAALAIRT